MGRKKRTPYSAEVVEQTREELTAFLEWARFGRRLWVCQERKRGTIPIGLTMEELLDDFYGIREAVETPEPDEL